MTSPNSPTDFEESLPESSFEPPPKQRRWLQLLLAALLLLGGGAIVWRLLTPQQQTAQNAQPPGVRVKIAPVQTGTIQESSDFIANLESRRSVSLQPRIQGQVTQIFVRSGDRVAEGTPIIQVDPRQQQAAVSGLNAGAQGARAQLQNALATLKSLQADRLSNVADVQLNQQDYNRYVTLAAEGAVSRQVRDQYANRLATSKAQLNAIDSKIQAQQATISQAEKALQQAEANTKQQVVELQYYKITAPFAGTVGNIPVKVGDFVNNSTQLATITQNQPLEVNVSIPLERGAQLRQGLPVEVMDAQGQPIGKSKIFFISPSVGNGTQAIQVKALLNNSQGKLRADQLVRAKVIWNQKPGVLIPTTAVSRVAGETFAYVAQTENDPQGKPQLIARQKRIKLGNIQGNNYQVLEGLQPEEQIIVSGLLNLRDGVPVIAE
ncbi:MULTISPECIES: efflux RND transporter periplasmic adaptor subunit [unclassified Tolypothrix]|uniref:efflux RND transporter periplasmic adaptor subunit n=1 Tax=unclassified Tolypothrix TaxID=2649714 RepID=UPI0005EAA421|nr:MULTISPECIES: efflux RND transporter periplasmic adaptor subunit [unclassified Tolypothrix]BAY92530.1 secretion protein HlyD [Microchaete diplosiphon NIES-3275]EKF05592.1 efflux transporter, RND family, MFP subunit [Tolypothrix sp. PCC 7601]MBE9085428.1 efflux RND transporter periplasmic adaptor subunit [Tolypothrix sp. LEGE 11397]UYD26483.1 efflux RND transporter periplasmic adaptor subunit [Tolypothrix sp. PCC 7712]UYD31278.1 efflux RND transporter periplasmic adaptor subunit [Tolypothrix